MLLLTQSQQQDPGERALPLQELQLTWNMVPERGEERLLCVVLLPDLVRAEGKPVRAAAVG